MRENTTASMLGTPSNIAIASPIRSVTPSLDISWTVIAEAYFDTPEKRALYVEFFNRYPTRILAGTDFVAASNKNILYHRRQLLTFVGPISHSDGHDGFGFIDELVPGLAASLDDGVVVFENTV